MPNPYDFDEVADLAKSHKKTIRDMLTNSQEAGRLGRRSLSLWGQFVGLVSEDERTAAGAKVLALAQSCYEQAIAEEVAAIDATALSLGKTRQEILDDYAAAPATQF